MAVQPPIKTTSADVDAVLGFLRTEVGWVPLDQIRRTIPSSHADNRKIEALKYLGLIDRDQDNVKLTDEGRRLAEATSAEGKAAVMRDALPSVSLYDSTLKWMHHNGKEGPSKVDIANYWHDKQEDSIGGASGAALTDAAILFLRVADMAGLGKFVSAGTGRPTHLKVDESALASYATGAPSPAAEALVVSQPEPAAPQQVQPTATVVSPAVSSQVHVTVEIHIAADAKAATIESIFKNMREYVLGHDDGSDSGT